MSTWVSERDARQTTEAARTGMSRAGLRRMNFLYQDGVMVSSTLRSLDDLGILEASLADERSLAEIYPDVTPEGFGYLRAGLRCLAQQGWLAADPTLEPDTTVLLWTDTGRLAAQYRDRYVALGRFLASFSSSAGDAWSRPWTDTQTAAFTTLIERARDRWQVELGPPLHELVTSHLDACLAVPTMLWVAGSDRLGDDAPRLPDDGTGRSMAQLLDLLGWTDGRDGRWTELGRQMRPYAEHFGLVGSYLPLLARLTDLYRGTQCVAGSAEGGAAEWHVQRELNVIASSAAHGRYFGDADELFLEIFNREPVEAQPRFVADVGSGDGSWLVHLYRLVRGRTLRGTRLDSDPLVMVGIDYNAAALECNRRSFEEAGVPSVLLTGDVTDPEGIGRALAEHGLTMEDGLHIRSFLDHDREYRGAGPDVPATGWASGAYLDAQGRPLDGGAVERDLVAHLRRWAPYARRHGMIMLEAHCVPSRVARRHVGALHSIAFDSYHAYSHQYPIEHSAFVRCCQEAGLQPTGRSQRRYPSSRPFVAVSLNRFVATDTKTPLPALRPDAPRHDTWRPDPGAPLDDGRALHELLFAHGDIRDPRAWCLAPTGFVIGAALAEIEARLALAGEGDVIRVLDYGTGTGLAAIELLKACREAGIEERLASAGAALELHLADLPSSWFAQGYELLRDCEWTRFHALTDADGRFRPLLDVTRGRQMDVVMASMVFHLVPPRALERLTDELAEVTKPGGSLLWNSPDLGPPGAHAVLFHDPNRALRDRWLALVDGETGAGAPDRVREAARRARATLGPADRRKAQSRAERRILPRAHAAGDVATALARRFDGHAESRTYEMFEDEIVETILVPSNQAEYLPEIGDRRLREDVIRELLLGDVLPAMQDGPAGTGTGLNIQWTLGSVRKPSAGRGA